MSAPALLKRYDDLCPSPDVNQLLIPDINFTQGQLIKAVDEAIAFHQNLASSVIVTPERGMVSCLDNLPDWAPPLIEKNGIAGALVEKIGSLTYVKRRPDDTKAFQDHVQSCLDKESPLTFRIAFGPLKNINLPMCQQSPDFAEYLAFIQLSRLMSALAYIYPHGLKVQLVPDNMRAQAANRCPINCVRSYINGLVELTKGLGFDQWLNVEEDQIRLYKLYDVENYRARAEMELLNWKMTDPVSFDQKWQSACFNAQKNIPQNCHSDQEEIESAAWRYLITHRAEILSGMWSPQDAFPLIYANHPNAFQLYSLGYKKTKLPWQIALSTSLLPNIAIPGLR